ncbi:hypothetical protein EGR_01655 [Echinococcus granulosus]|uniref:Uncharacterized protein n=1 Tax=Echinococcus granulosus TaxID=6210 RepID=W6UQS1_ECHGR|nr:hypothetical protein EGR_01655 [Echinococcus granulosus]EUB63573.1 hypothetical protein EGR_01655 [Echinococcus granulosus]
MFIDAFDWSRSNFKYSLPDIRSHQADPPILELWRKADESLSFILVTNVIGVSKEFILRRERQRARESREENPPPALIPPAFPNRGSIFASLAIPQNFMHERVCTTRAPRRLARNAHLPAPHVRLPVCGKSLTLIARLHTPAASRAQSKHVLESG